MPSVLRTRTAQDRRCRRRTGSRRRPMMISEPSEAGRDERRHQRRATCSADLVDRSGRRRSAAGRASPWRAIRPAPGAPAPPSMPRPTSSAGASADTRPSSVPRRGSRSDRTARRSRRARPRSAARARPAAFWSRIWLPDELDRADVEAAGRLRGDQEHADRARAPGPGSASAGSHRTACPPSRRCSARGRRTAGRAVRASSLIFPSEQDAARSTNGGSSCRPSSSVLPQGHVQHESLRVSILGDEPDTCVRGSRRYCGPGEVLAVEHDPARRRAGRRPMTASASSRWPFPSTPATPTISPARTSRRQPLQASAGEVLEPKDGLADLDLRLLETEQHRPAHHHLGELRLRGLRRRRLADDDSPPQDRDAVGDRRGPRRACG